MSEVRELNAPWYGKLDPDQVLTAAVGKLKSVLIIGEALDGTAYYAGSERDAENMLWKLARAQFKLLRGDFT